MSGADLLIIIFGFLIGYWLVSRLGSGDRKPKQQPDNQAWSGQESPYWHRQQTGRKAQEQQHTQQLEAAHPLPWHEVLNVSPYADLQEIRSAYKTLMSQYHPDKVASLGPEIRELSERKTKEINTAYDCAIAERGIT